MAKANLKKLGADGSTKRKKIRLRKAILQNAMDILSNKNTSEATRIRIMKMMAPYVLQKNPDKEERRLQAMVENKKAREERQKEKVAEKKEMAAKKKKRAAEVKTEVAQPVGLKKQRKQDAIAVANGSQPSRWTGVAQQSH